MTTKPEQCTQFHPRPGGGCCCMIAFEEKQRKEREKKFAEIKAAKILAEKDSVWNNGVEEAAERIAYHCLNFDARDISAFRYLVKLATRQQEIMCSTRPAARFVDNG